MEEGGAESVMSAYNKVNGEYCGENAKLLNGILRDVWGCENILVTSDWLYGFRNAAKSVNAGLDIEMPHRAMRVKSLSTALENGEVTMAAIDRLAARIIRYQLKYQVRILGTLDPNRDVVRSLEHRRLALRAACRSMVLLKNSRDILPLRSVRRLLVIGELATSTQTGDQGSSAVRDPDIVTPLKGLQGQYDVDISYLDGKDLKAVERESKLADAVFLLVGYTSADEGEFLLSLDPDTLQTVMPQIFPYRVIATALRWVISTVGPMIRNLLSMDPGAGGDRKTMRLKEQDERLAAALVELAGDKLILGLETSGPVILPKMVRDGAASILVTGYGGSQFGNALREVLFGDSEPGGRLAYGIVESERDIPAIDMASVEVTYDRWWGYRWTQRKNVQPTYPFGFGLGYGSAQLLTQSVVTPDRLLERFFEVCITVKNTGQCATSQVVQVYLGKQQRDETDYKSVLVGFARTRDLLKAESESVRVQCRIDPVAHWETQNQRFRVTEGLYDISICCFEGDQGGATKSLYIAEVEWSVKTGTK